MTDLIKRANQAAVLNRHTQPAAIQGVIDGGDADEVITLLTLFPAWTARAYVPGDTILWADQPYTCLQPHDAEANPNWTPETAPNLWRPWHARSPELALFYVQPLGNGYQYGAGEYMRWRADEEDAEKVYLCLADDVVHTPADRPDAWAVYGDDSAEEPGGDRNTADGTGDTGETDDNGDGESDNENDGDPDITDDIDGDSDIPDWTVWDGNNESLYRTGDVVRHNGQLWRSTADSNHWEPGVYGWELIE